MAGRRGIQTIYIGQQDQRVGCNHLRHIRGQTVIVAKAKLASSDRIILVNNRNNATAEQAIKRRTHVRVVFATHDVFSGEQQLSDIKVVRLKCCRPASNQEPLPHRGSSLNACQIARTRIEAQRIQTRCNRTGRDNNDLFTRRLPLRDQARYGINTVQIQATIIAAQRRGSNFDDNTVRIVDTAVTRRSHFESLP